MILDFNQAEAIKKELIHVDGWIYPLEVEYGIFKYSWEKYLIWRIVGTENIFRVSLKIVTSQHGSKYIEHIHLALKQLREDLFNWKKINLPEDWMFNYWNQFNRLIY